VDKTFDRKSPLTISNVIANVNNKKIIQLSGDFKKELMYFRCLNMLLIISIILEFFKKSNLCIIQPYFGLLRQINVCDLWLNIIINCTGDSLFLKAQ